MYLLVILGSIFVCFSPSETPSRHLQPGRKHITLVGASFVRYNVIGVQLPFLVYIFDRTVLISFL